MSNHELSSDERRLVKRVATDLAFTADRLDRGAFREPDRETTYRRELHDAEREAIEPLLTAGFELIGEGIARCVCRTPSGESVVKLARFGPDPVSHGASQNKRETLVWHRHGNDDWPLVPVTAYDTEQFAWLVMPYGEPITDRPEPERERLVEQVRSRIRFCPAFDMRELFADNVVRVDGEPLLADYGLPEGL